MTHVTPEDGMLHWSGGEFEYSEDCGCPRCVDFRKPPRECPNECSHCSQCRAAVSFSWDPVEKEWMSDCCGARAVAVDLEPDMNF